MQSSFHRFVRALALLVGLLWASVPVAQAQSGTLDTYRPAPTPEDDFQLPRPTDLGSGRFGAALTLDYALNPLVWEDDLGDASSERLAVVEHQLVGTVGLALGLADRVVLYGGIPAVLVMSGADSGAVQTLGPNSADGSGLGDAYLGARLRLVGEAADAFALGVQTTVTLPTSSGQYSGDDGVSALPMLSAEIRPGRNRIVLAAGTLLRSASLQRTTNVEFSNELRFGAGLGIPLWIDEADPRGHLDLLVQYNGGSAYRDFFGREATNSELLGGLKLATKSGLILAGGAGPGLTRGIGTPDLRAVLSIGWLPAEPPPPAPVDPCKDTPEDRDGFQDDDGCDDPDNDQDGILDGVDKCPNEPENRNDWEDGDGCPDTIPDTDGDGLLDPKDRCPMDPEDVDQFEDEDGCPDPDNDKDGVLDIADKCPNEPGIVENRGCPDKDRDADTVVDRRDNCPDVPGPPSNMGCPEKQKQTVRIEESKIEILDTVYFRTDSDEILKKSFGLLDNVATVLNAHPEIEKIRVEGHTDSRGKRDHNLDLSNRRAASVMKYLVGKGVDAKRLESRGFGPDKPVVPDAKSAAEHAKNRRVVFHILGETDEVSATDSGPTKDHIDR